MRKIKVITLFSMVSVVAALASAASLDEARRLYQAGSTEAALSEIDAVLDSEASDADKAQALDLLGTIAVDQGYLTMARDAWSRLLDEYPEAANTGDVGTKLQLVSALLETRGSAEAPEGSAEQEVAAAEEPAAPAPSVVEKKPTPTAAEALESTEPRPAPAVASSRSSGRVLIAGRGKPYDAVKGATDRIVASLREQGVDAESATGGIPVVEDSQMVLPMLLQKGQQESAGSVLLLTADYVTMQKMVLECYTPDGAKLWKLKVSGGTGWKGRPYSKTGITEELAERFMKKLEEKVGEPGLPVTLW